MFSQFFKKYYCTANLSKTHKLGLKGQKELLSLARRQPRLDRQGGDTRRRSFRGDWARVIARTLSAMSRWHYRGKRRDPRAGSRRFPRLCRLLSANEVPRDRAGPVPTMGQSGMTHIRHGISTCGEDTVVGVSFAPPFVPYPPRRIQCRSARGGGYPFL